MIDDAEMPMIERSNELLVQVKAASVNVVDTKICYGYSKIYRRLLNSGVRKLKCSILSYYLYLSCVTYSFSETQRTPSNIGQRLYWNSDRYRTKCY